MKRLLSALAFVAIALLPIAGSVDAANNPRSFTQTLNTTTKTSDALDTNTNGSGVGFTVAVTGTFSANWRLQRSVDNGSTWTDFFVIDQADALCVSAQAPALWRLSAAGIGDFTSGSAAVSFVKGGGDCTTPVTRLMTKDRAAVSSANPLPVTVGAALPAGSNLIGQVTTPATIKVSATQTVTASSIYTSRNAVGGKITFANAVRTAAGGGVVQACALTDKAGQSVAYDLFLFDADPSSTTVTDKSAVAVNTGDLTKAIGVVQFAGISLGAASTMGVFTSAGLGLSFSLPSGTSLYGILVVTGAPTYASTSDVTVTCRIMPD